MNTGYPPELRQQAIRLVVEAREQEPELRRELRPGSD
jgi:hypothetical protein